MPKPLAAGLYLVDHGAILCTKHLGMTARMTGRDLSGQRILRVDNDYIRDCGHVPFTCETCTAEGRRMTRLRPHGRRERCQCGTVTGESCDWQGTIRAMVIVEWMPVSLRASHEAAHNIGVYPLNGAVRLLVARVHAGEVDDTRWCRIVED